MTIVNTAAKRLDPKCSHHKEKLFFSFISSYKMMDANCLSFHNMCNQIIMLYTLNFYNAVCQLELKKNKKK